MPLTVTLTANHTFPAGQPVTLAALRKAAAPSVSLAGSVATGDLVAGAVTPAKTSPGAYFYGAATLSVDTYSVTLTPSLSALTNGALVRFRVDVANPSGGTKLNVDGLGGKPIVKHKGLALAQGDLRANHECLVSYDATANVWQLQSGVANHGDRYGTCGGSANAYTLTHDGTSSGQQTVVALPTIHGVPLRFRASFTNTDTVTLNVDGLGPKAIRMWDDKAMPNGYIKQNQIVTVVYDSALDEFFLPWSAKDTAIGGAVRNLVLKAAAASGVDDDLTVTADDVVVKDAAGNAVSVGAINKTLNPTGAGAAGFDSGAPVSGTWYFVWVIWDGTNINLLGSASSSAPTMPAGYTHKGLVGEWLFETTTNPRATVAYGERKTFSMVGTGGIAALDTPMTFAHRLGMVPKVVLVRLVCATGESNYSTGDEVDSGALIASGSSSPFFGMYVDATNVKVVAASGFTAANTPRTINHTPGALATLTAANWNVRVIATT